MLYLLYCTVLYCTVLYCTVLYCTALHCNVLYCTALDWTNFVALCVMICTVLHCTVRFTTCYNVIANPLLISPPPHFLAHLSSTEANSTGSTESSKDPAQLAVAHISDRSEFAAIIASNHLTVVAYWAPWCKYVRTHVHIVFIHELLSLQ